MDERNKLFTRIPLRDNAAGNMKDNPFHCDFAKPLPFVQPVPERVSRLNDARDGRESESELNIRDETKY